MLPQFDYTTYSSQVFWFLICFSILYFFISKIITPRISKIIENRANIINSDKSVAEELDEKILQIELKNAELLKSANEKYQQRIESVIKETSREKEQVLSDLKAKIDDMNQKSRQEIKDFVAQSQSRIEKSIQDLTNEINKKILN